VHGRAVTTSPKVILDLQPELRREVAHPHPEGFCGLAGNPVGGFRAERIRKALAKALDSLPEKYRTVLVLRDVQHLSITETAQALGLSEANVKTRLCRARLQMRDALAPGIDGVGSRGRTYEKVRPF
jgi:RNA polymerase sigma factor (sigma-70 family)